MKKCIIMLLFMLCACASQKIETEYIKVDDTLDFESQTDQESHMEVEEVVLKPDSVQKEPKSKKSSAPETTKSNEKEDEVIYGSIRYEEITVSFKTLPSVNDSAKEQGTSGYISKGSDGLNRKEVRDVYINGKYSHTETVKDIYIVSKPIDEQKWIGTKEPPAIVEELEEINYIFYKTYDSFDTCNYQANELARINSKNGWLSTMCDGPNLYYTLRE